MPHVSSTSKKTTAKITATTLSAAVLMGIAGPAIAENPTPAPTTTSAKAPAASSTKTEAPAVASSNKVSLSAVESAIQNLDADKGDIVSVETSEADAFKATPNTKKKPVTGGDNPGAMMGQSLKKEGNVGFVPESSKQILQQVAAATSDDSLKENIKEKIDATASPKDGGAAVSTWKPGGIQGMDVSGWQPTVNWSAEWNKGARFAYIKSSEGNYYKSEAFGDQYSGAYNAGMIRGAYHFAYPTVGGGAAEADFFINNGGGWSADGKTLPGLLDIEYNPYGQICYDMSQSQMRTWIQQFSDRYKQRTGRLPAIYSTTSWWKSCTGNTTIFNDHPLHIAAFNNVGAGELFAGRTNYDIWQYSESGPFAGDSNQFAGSSAKLTDLAKNKYYTPIGGKTPAGATTSTPKPPAPVAAKPATSYTVKGGIAGKYRALGGESALGKPIMNEKGDGRGGVYQEFVKSGKKTVLYWTAKYGTHKIETWTGIGGKWVAAGKADGYGQPTNSAVKIANGGWYQTFVKDGKTTKVLWTSATGTYAVNESGGIGGKWKQKGHERGLGYPTTDERKLADGGVYQVFKNGGAVHKVMWSPTTGANVVKESGAIGGKWKAAGFENGYGYPTGDERSEGNGVVSQSFRKGNSYTTVFWKSGERTNAIKTSGGIGGKWKAAGGLNGYGYPTTEEQNRGDGIISQSFKKGSTTTTVYWKSGKRTIAHQESGDIAAKFKSGGGVNILGLPITEKIQNSDGGYYQKFQRGSTVYNIAWVSGSGAKIVKENGGIGKQWVESGREKGSLGYPTSDEVQSGGEVYQKFQKGTLHWATAQSSGWITK